MIRWQIMNPVLVLALLLSAGIANAQHGYTQTEIEEGGRQYRLNCINCHGPDGNLVGGIDFSNVFVALNGKSYPTMDAAKTAGAATLNVGLFINAVIQFLIVAFVIFWTVRALNKMVRAAPPPPPPLPPASEEYLREIRDLLKSKS